MKLRDFTLEKLAEMVVGNNQAFSYRSSYFITQFFTRCDLPYRHDGSTRHRWANDVLAKLNLETGRANPRTILAGQYAEHLPLDGGSDVAFDEREQCGVELLEAWRKEHVCLTTS